MVRRHFIIDRNVFCGSFQECTRNFEPLLPALELVRWNDPVTRTIRQTHIKTNHVRGHCVRTTTQCFIGYGTSVWILMDNGSSIHTVFLNWQKLTKWRSWILGKGLRIKCQRTINLLHGRYWRTMTYLQKQYWVTTGKENHNLVSFCFPSGSKTRVDNYQDQQYW